MIVLHSLGRAEIETAVTTVTPSQEIVFAAALYLILERGKRVSRVRLASLLWPRVPDKARGHRLRQTILQLKKLGMVITADRDNVQLSPREVRTDVDAGRLGRTNDGAIPEALEFLPGYNPPLSEQFRNWVETKRSEIHASWTRALVRDLEAARLSADWARVDKLAAQCLTLDSYNETAVLAQAEAAAMRGGKRHALSILDQYIAEVGDDQSELRLPAALLRRRVVERIPDRSAILNADPPFVGREAEMALLTKGFERSRRGNGCSIAVIGEPGIGKTRLSAELARFAELQGAYVQRATCRRTDLERPLSLFVDIVPQLREAPGALGCAPETLASLKRLTEFDVRIGDTSRMADSELLFHNVQAALFDLLDAVADERCLLILIEDVQWLDAASARTVGRMLEWCTTKRIFFLLNSRSKATHFLDFAEKTWLETITLGRLNPEASIALLRSTALRPGDEPEREFVDWCLKVAEGNPFFLQELARHWIETGRRYEAPPSVANVLAERLARLSGDARRVLQTCAILADQATLDRVEKVLEYRPHQLLAAVEELSKAAMLEFQPESSESSSNQIRPRHDFLASAAVTELAPVSRAFLHRRSAQVLERESAEETVPTTLLWACANHRHHAGDRKRALSLGLACAQHLLELGLSAEASRRFEDSQMYCTSTEDRISLLPRLATALQVNGEWERSKDALRTCIRLSSTTGNKTHSEFEILLFQARHRSSLDFTALLEDLMPCIESPQAAPAHRVSAAVIALKVASDVGPSGKLDAIYAQIEPFLGRDEIDPVARSEAEIIYQTMRAEREIPVTELEVFTKLARTSHGEIAFSNALLAAASACRISGRDEPSKRFVSEALAHAVSHKLLARIPAILLSEVRLHVSAGDFRAAKRVLERTIDYPIPADDQITQAEWSFFEARIALEHATLEECERAIMSVEIGPPTYSITRRAACLALFIRLRLRQRSAVEVLEPLIRSLEAAHLISRDIGNQDFETHALFLGLTELGEEDRAARLLDDYVNKYRRSTRPLFPAISDLMSSTGRPFEPAS